MSALVLTPLALALFAGTSTSIELYDSELTEGDASGYVGQLGVEPVCKAAAARSAFRKQVELGLAVHAKSGSAKSGMPHVELAPKDVEAFAKVHCRLHVGSTLWAHGPQGVAPATIETMTGLAWTRSPATKNYALSLTAKVARLKTPPWFFVEAQPKRPTNAFLASVALGLAEDALSPAARRRLAAWEPKPGALPKVKGRTLYALPLAADLKAAAPSHILARVDFYGSPPMESEQRSWATWVIVDAAGDHPATVVLHGDVDRGYGSDDLELVGLVDADDDGRREVLLEAEYAYFILHQKGGKWLLGMLGKRASD